MPGRSIPARTGVILCCLLFPCVRPVLAQTDSAAPLRPVLVELFTSEGCSSCPPADELLRKIDGKRTDSGQLIVGVSEHVTYWNHDGWTDPFSASAWTDRQAAYGDRFHIDSVYTPQVVVNGERQVLGSDGNAILRAVRESSSASSALGLHIEEAQISGTELVLSYFITSNVLKSRADLYAVLADNTDSSQVQHGENSGRTLTHVSVARGIFALGEIKASGAGKQTVRLPLKKLAGGSADRHVILFAQAAHSGPILEVDSLPVASDPSPGGHLQANDR